MPITVLCIFLSVGAAETSSQITAWGLSDKIAAWAVGIALLQFLALVSTIWVMIRSSRRQLRAYVLPEHGSISEGNMLNPPQPARANIPGVVMAIKNSGQTPAYNLISWMQITVIQEAHENTLVVPPLVDQFPLTLGVNSSFTKSLWLDRALTPNEIAEIGNGKRGIYVYGRIEYQDAFKVKRFANFRLRYMGQFPPLPNAIFWFCASGNDAD